MIAVYRTGEFHKAMAQKWLTKLSQRIASKTLDGYAAVALLYEQTKAAADKLDILEVEKSELAQECEDCCRRIGELEASLIAARETLLGRAENLN